MATAQLVLDFDTRKFFDGNGTALPSWGGKKDSIREYELSVIQDDVPLSFPNGTTITVALKSTSSPAGTLLGEFTASRRGWGTCSRWFFTLDLTDDAFAGSAVLGKNVDFEVLIEFADGQRIPSLTIPFAIQKNVLAA